MPKAGAAARQSRSPHPAMLAVLRLLLLCLSCTATGAWATAPLLTPAQTKALGESGARLIDIREGPAYALQHVPGAVSAPYPLWRAPGANAVTKQLALAAPRLSRDEMLDRAADGFAGCLLGDEGREGVASFLEKRKPRWAL